MRGDDRFISASEIGAWCYCKRAWYLSQRGYPSTLTEERASGTRYHEAHNQHLRAARRQCALARVVMLVCLLILIMLAIVNVWTR